MKPLNLDNRPCSPVSSNCVIWQGPTLTCIDLCTGDTISDVVAKMAEELCTLLDQTNVSNYDLSCFGITACGPKDFQALIQLLIEKICELEGLPTDTTRTEDICPTCIVTVKPCFVQNGQTTMPLVDYVQMIAEKICSLIIEIGELQSQIDNLNIRVTVLEEATPPSFTLPSINVDCDLGESTSGLPVNPATSQTIDIVLDALINDNTHGYCAYTSILGSLTELTTGISRKCILNGTNLLSGPGTFGSLATWVPDASYSTVGDAINNIWVVLCDMFDAIENTSLTVLDTNSIDLTFTSGTLSANIVDTGWVNLNGFEFYAVGVGKPQCRRIGNVVYFRGTAVVPLVGEESTPLEFNNSAGSNTYLPNTTVTPSTTGLGSVYLDTGAGVLYWNSNTSVIPSSVVAPTASGTTPNYYFDNVYVKQFTLGTRGIVVRNSVDGSDLISTVLNTVGTLFITKDGKLAITTVRDSEESNVSLYQSPYSFNTSHLNYIVSHVVLNEFVPNFQALATTVHSSAASGVQTVDIDHTQSATWTIARSAPTTPVTYQYRFSFNGNDVNSLGAVSYALDGLVAYIDPCTTDIKEYVCN
jgi:hypothetical protein